jgi:hypothetical protein
MRCWKLLTIVLCVAGWGSAAEARREHPYRQHWKESTFGKKAVGRVVAGAGINQLRHHPKEWSGASGFGKRVGAGFATNAVGSTVHHLVAAPLHEDLHYHRSNKRGFGPRLAYALKSTVIVRNTKNGKRRPAAGRLAGHAASGAFAQAVLPGVAGASTAGVGLAADAGANVAREFWPRHHKTAAVRRQKTGRS